MRLEWAFRVSGYMTLGLACVCLGLAASPFVPGLRMLIVPVLVALAVEWCLEGRLTLPAWAANLLGIVIACGGTTWMGWQLYRQIHKVGLEDVSMPAALLPFLGPVLMVLILAKLLRPKQPLDYWVLQGLGLVLVVLSCVLGSEPVLGLFLLAYLVCGLWHLAMFHVRRETAAALAGAQKPPEAAHISLTGSLLRATLWGGAALLVGLPLFLLLPRQGQSAWNPYQLFGGPKPTGGPRIVETGFTNEIDLNSTGEVEITDEVALTVQVQDDRGRPKLDLSADQRWRGAVLEHYANGRWMVSAPLTVQIPAGPAITRDVEPRAIPEAPPVIKGDPEPLGPPGQPIESRAAQPREATLRTPPKSIGSAPAGDTLPNLGPDQFFLTYSFQARVAGGLFLAEPVVLRSDPQAEKESFPVVSFATDPTKAPLFHELRRTLQPSASFGRGEYSYRQVARPTAEPDLSESVDRVKADLEYLRARRADTRPVGAWTEQLLERLVANGASGLTKFDIEQVAVERSTNTAPRHVEKVAVALTEYLARSGQYTYTLDRRRADSSIDPTLDFLENVKQGHCERFAGALALMLQSIGVHARIVVGYRGAESRGDGTYVIRHNFAHSWVEALVQRSGSDGVLHWHWRTLDPTPSTEAPPATPFSWARWWETHREKGEAMWKDLIVNYESAQQDALWSDTRDWLSNDAAAAAGGIADLSWRPFAFLVFAAAVAVPVFRFALRFRPRSRSPLVSRTWDVPFYSHLLALLARHAQLRPKPTQTPREFAEAARHFLAAWQTTAPLADIPARLAGLFYRVRYGASPLSTEESRSVEQELQRLEQELQSANCRMQIAK